MIDLEYLAGIIEQGKTQEVIECVEALLDAGIKPETIINDGVMPGMREVGQKFEDGKIFISEMLLASRAANLGSEYMHSRMDFRTPVSGHKILLGTVRGDVHDIGKNLVAMAMRSIGVEVIDLGVDVPVEHFVAAVESNPDIAFVGLSAILTMTLPAMKQTVKALRSCEAASRIRILVGGAPVTAKLAKSYGADIYTETAYEAAVAVRTLLQQEGILPE
ncbi:MAG: cobalamin-dependent protein [Oscillospiraceae bacterium]|nr:cobalamin-dependent protein [Oscillospiraceae bacterium]